MPDRAPEAFRVASPDQLVEDLATLSGPVLVAGDGALRHRASLEAALGPQIVIAGPELAAAPVASLVVLAIAAMEAGSFFDPAEVRPIYGREADAAINWSSRESREAVDR
jgi:hypothetical protein